MSRVSVNIALRWADMDAYGHVNNVNQVRLMEEARVAAFGVPGGTGEPVGRPGKVDLFENVGEHILILVVDHSISYVAQLPYRDVPVRIEVWIDQVKGASFRVNYEFFDGHTGELTTRATTTLALFDDETQRLVRLPAEHRAAFKAYADDAQVSA
ncbi:acyl-CoA thioesterase [Galactobacter valiniphilus]|uniref:acyl-CoA thioesterase n=1 Tax=Galactobacter valiniphilus TaxID=2676122 RepID=UPI003735D469